eukprot:CAMPEP_0182865296 /NCGR_PEP_ID=MMETSP0034_2-20130328/7618_1 /TAXON_ID=156128 /ORGANISM="Nephroselmis pyriformis, Strain CCMP717" /LENGTH=77 /DNA_ID=CAMNT_0024997591 /DNA_START=120 /DNA_END=353 /DNA_ORIENTATION=+
MPLMDDTEPIAIKQRPNHMDFRSNTRGDVRAQVWALVEGLHASGTLPAAAKHWWSALAVYEETPGLGLRAQGWGHRA